MARLLAARGQGEGTASRSARALRGAAAAVVVALPIALLALLVREQFNPLIRFDEGVIRSATDFTRSSGLAPLFIAIQEATQPRWVHAVGVLVAVWAWLAKGLRARALWAVATLMVGWFLGFAVKLVVQRARPVWDSSGQSRKTSTETTTAMFVAAAVVVALTVGLDRVFLGAHFPSDVFAGLVLGVGITFSSWIGFIGKTAVTSSPGPSAPASSSGD